MIAARSRTSAGGSPARIFWGFLVVIADAEVVTSFVHARAGLALYTAILASLIFYATIVTTCRAHELALSLTAAPLIRIVSLSLPLAYVPHVVWYPLVAAPLIAWVAVVVRRLGLSRREVGLQCGNLSAQTLLIGLGLALGPVAFRLLRPVSLDAPSSARALWLPALSLVLSTGLTDEAILRGILQSTARHVLGPWAVVYVALLGTALQIGFGSLAVLCFALGAGLLFGWIVERSGSILGAGLAHGATNVIWLLVMPYVARHHPGDAPAVATAIEVTGLLLAGAGLALLFRRTSGGQLPVSENAAPRLPLPGAGPGKGVAGHEGRGPGSPC